MGIKGFNIFINKTCPECITINPIQKYSGKTVGIDVSILLYKFRYMSSINNTFINSHITGFISRILYYRKNNITPVFIFDGVPPKQKHITLKKRQLAKKKIYEKIELLQELKPETETEKDDINNEIDKLSSQIINVNKTHINDIKTILNLLGINYYDAPDEAEKYCVYLQQENIIDYIITDDTDIFTFGGTNVLKSSIKNNIIETDIDMFMNKIEYDKNKFIDFCILSGCDYLPTVPSLAINTVYSLFKKHDNIESIMSLNKYTFPEEYSDIDDIRNIFKVFDYIKPDKLKHAEIDIENFKIFLENKEIANSDKIVQKFKLN